jgi:hypothetical protein
VLVASTRAQGAFERNFTLDRVISGRSSDFKRSPHSTEPGSLLGQTYTLLTTQQEFRGRQGSRHCTSDSSGELSRHLE